MKPPIISGVILAFDFGLKRIGVAVGQTITKTARPLETLPAIAGCPAPEKVQALYERFCPAAMLVGVPLTLAGRSLSVTEAAKNFAKYLQSRYNIPVYEVDERLTTKEARAQLFESGGYRALTRGQIDAVAAAIILDQWLKTYE